MFWCLIWGHWYIKRSQGWNGQQKGREAGLTPAQFESVLEIIVEIVHDLWFMMQLFHDMKNMFAHVYSKCPEQKQW